MSQLIMLNLYRLRNCSTQIYGCIVARAIIAMIYNDTLQYLIGQMKHFIFVIIMFQWWNTLYLSLYYYVSVMKHFIFVIILCFSGANVLDYWIRQRRWLVASAADDKHSLSDHEDERRDDADQEETHRDADDDNDDGRSSAFLYVWSQEETTVREDAASGVQHVSDDDNDDGRSSAFLYVWSPEETTVREDAASGV